MALARTRRGESGMNYWPGFVDALSTLILSIIFILTVFVVVQFYLQQEVAGKDTALTRLNAQIAQLTELLSLENTGQLEGEKKISSRALAQVEILNQQIAALRRQLAAIEVALDASEKKDKEAQNKIADLGQRLNLALAQKVQELTKYRSDFFGKLRAILGNRPDMRVVGDRFVLQSELFFDTGKADLKPEALTELDKVAGALVELEKQIPTDIAWVLRVDGHTDVRPVTGGVFKSNWNLSAARAISVVQYLGGHGVSPQRLVATCFG